MQLARSSTCHSRPGQARAAITLIGTKTVVPRQACCAAFTGESHDVVLSSGFLAFAQHSGFLQAVEEAGIPIGGVMGTSAGALTGSLYAAGYSPRQVAQLLSEKPPIQFLKPSLEPWRGGLLSLEGVVDRLRELLPPTFEGLERDFAVGVVTTDGTHVLIDQGPLPEAVAASAAIPFVFSNVDVPGIYSGLKDGGVVDRIGLSAWRQRRRQQQQFGRRSARLPPCLVHVIERSSPFSGSDDTEAAGESSIHVVRCPKSGVNFFDLGNFEQQFSDAHQRASSRLQGYSATLAKLPQVSSAAAVHHQQQQQQSLMTNNVVVLPGSLGAASSSNGSPQLVVAAAASSSAGSSGSTGAAASPAGLTAPRSPVAVPRSSVRRAVQDDGSC